MGEFNLIDEPWIPVVNTGGAVRELGIRELFHSADECVGLAGDLPTQDFALLRLLLAILHRAAGPVEDTQAWEDINADWPWALTKVDAYLDEFHDKFFLFDADRPFFQVADLSNATGVPLGLEKLIADVPNGHPLFTTRLGSGLEQISAAEAARWLVHAQAYDPSGIRSGDPRDTRVKGAKGYPIGTGWAGQIGGIYFRGATLRETFMLNLVIAEVTYLVTGGEDLPPWERDPLPPEQDLSGVRGEHGPAGFVDLYTWQSRRIRLVGGLEAVTGLMLMQGDRMTPQNRQHVEPMTAWRYSKPQTAKLGQETYMPREYDPARSFWRGINGLLTGTDDPVSAGRDPEPYRHPELVESLSALVNLGCVGRSDMLRLTAIGVQYGSNNSVIAEIFHENLDLPAFLLTDDATPWVSEAERAVRAAEEAVSSLRWFAVDLERAAGGSGESAAGELPAEHAYAKLGLVFRDWLRSLNEGTDSAERAVMWQRAVLAVIDSLARDLIDRGGDAVFIGRVVKERIGPVVKERHIDAGLAERYHRQRLRKSLPWAFESTSDTGAIPEEVHHG